MSAIERLRERFHRWRVERAEKKRLAKAAAPPAESPPPWDQRLRGVLGGAP